MQHSAQCADLVLAPAAPRRRRAALQTRNVVLIVSDGLRWQEIFTGADPTLLNEKNGGIWDKEARPAARILARRRQRAPQGAVPVPVDHRRDARSDLRQPDQRQRGTRHQRTGLLLSRLQRNADRACGCAHQLQRVRPQSQHLGVRVAERPARVSRPRQRLCHLGDLQGHLQRSAQPSAAAGGLGAPLSRPAHPAAGAAQRAVSHHHAARR